MLNSTLIELGGLETHNYSKNTRGGDISFLMKHLKRLEQRAWLIQRWNQDEEKIKESMMQT